MTDAILTLNAGSSSIKFSLFGANGTLALAAHGEVEKIGIAPRLRVKNAKGDMVLERNWEHGADLSHEALLEPLLDWVTTHLDGADLLAAGHRIVHGGRLFNGPVRLDAANMAELATLVPLAPLHQPHNLAAVQAVMALRPDVPQIGCFDTAFHHDMPLLATLMAIPRHFHEEGMRRYGFHGLSYEFIARRLREIAPEDAKGRVIAAHLGNGASLCAMRDGRSVDSTMGMTALEGLMMGTRCGSIDPGAILYLMQSGGMDAEAITKLLYQQSGLLGVSGISADMRELLASAEPHAAEAVALFAYRAATEIAGLAVALEGLECLIFTAGIGEHAPAARAAICARLGWLGVVLDGVANQRNAAVISAPDSRVMVRVIPTDEDAMIAQHCLEVLAP